MSHQLHGQLSPEFNPFGEDYLAEILEAVSVAWSRMRQSKQRDWEDDITYRLAGRLQNDPIFNELPYDVIPQHWLLGMNGERLGRLDLRFKHRHSQRDYFAFESKRLHVTYPGGGTSPEYGDYVGDPGMMAFIEGQYSKNLPAAGMLGYVMDGETSKAWNGLTTRIEAKKDDLCLIKDSKLSESALAHIAGKGIAGTKIGETLHDLKTHSLRLLHLLLPVA